MENKTELILEDYCQGCPDFEPFTKIVKHELSGGAKSADVIISCKHNAHCQFIKKHIEQNLNKKTEELESECDELKSQLTSLKDSLNFISQIKQTEGGIFMDKTNFNVIKNFNIDELADFINKYCEWEYSPWEKWFTTNFCNSCERVMCHLINSTNEFPISWCDLNDNKCKFFPNLENGLSNKELIKIWLSKEYQSFEQEGE